MNTIEKMDEPTERSDANPDTTPDIIPVEPLPPTHPAGAESTARRLWKIPAKITLLVGGVALVYWRRGSLQNASPYTPVVIPSLILLSQIIFKDWNNYKHRWVRWLLLSCALAGGAWGIVYQNQQIKDKAAAKTRADAAEKAQHDNTTQFLASLQNLNSQLNSLDTKIATEPLRNELNNLKAELATVQGDLEKTPAKASLAFSFAGFATSDNTLTPVKEISVTPSADGIVTLPIFVLNSSETAATQGHSNIVICDLCKFAKEPAHTQRLPSQPEQARDFQFGQILPFEASSDLTLDITVPRNISNFQIGFIYRCQTCALDKSISILIVHVNWPQPLRTNSLMRFLPSFRFTPEPPAKKK